MKMYIGVIERNPLEGHLGYYWENNESNRKGLQRLKEMYGKGWIGCEEGQYEFLFDPISGKDLQKLDPHPKNEEMSRVNIIEDTDWEQIINKFDVNKKDGDPLYRGQAFLDC